MVPGFPVSPLVRMMSYHSIWVNSLCTWLVETTTRNRGVSPRRRLRCVVRDQFEFVSDWAQRLGRALTAKKCHGDYLVTIWLLMVNDGYEWLLMVTSVLIG